MWHRYNSRSFRVPATPDLPSDRINIVTPFKLCGIDYTGHFFIRNTFNEKVKVYILLFTCLVICIISCTNYDSVCWNW